MELLNTNNIYFFHSSHTSSHLHPQHAGFPATLDNEFQVFQSGNLRKCQIREKSGNFIMFTRPKEKVVVTLVCCFFITKWHIHWIIMIGYGGFSVWKSLLFCLSLGDCGEFGLYPHHGILTIHQGKVEGNQGIVFSWNDGNPDKSRIARAIRGM